MEQNSMLKRYLIIGLIFSFGIFFNSCKDNFYDQFGEFHYVNSTTYSITYDAGLTRFNVAPKSTTIIKEKFRGGKKATVSNYNVPTVLYSSEPSLKFNNVKCLIKIKASDINSMSNIKNYVAEKISENNFKFTYTFTEADYDRATTCP